ncbi:4bb43fbb-fb90-4c5b-b468-08e0779dd3ae [Sclerotinia trifoliorum]|uniref:4bb43fbb-fb90-4c5b-b468-08e0779dd3ae n=1 Tax=Sclerotinia trifoliorum TaxID=28548 RepID=A0A8H2ZYC8_9HELO|nr:4bb43fbb-fb90-4c5b-b468-08e0779dd3ae [Sclerotinia trifoliorum]
MKTTTLSLAGFSLLQLTLAQPFNRHNAHRAIHNKRDLVTVVDTVVVASTEVQEVIIYVDSEGNPLSTTTKYVDNEPTTTYESNSVVPTSTSYATTTTPVNDVAVQPSTQIDVAAASTTPKAPSVQVSAAVSLSVAVPVPSIDPASPVAPAFISVAAPVVSSSSSAPVVISSSSAVVVPVVSSSSTTSSAAVASTSAVVASSGGFGFAYSPYMANSACKTQDQVNQDFAAIPSSYSTVRIYGTDCNQVTTTLVAAKKYGFKIFAGVYDFTEVATETQAIVDAVNGDWSVITTISIGNEWVNNGITDAAGVASAVATARGILSAAGYTGKIVAVDTLAATKLYPSLCDNVDYCAVNCHPFFDTNTAAEAAGTFLSTQISELRALLSNPDMEIVISETGWPSAGTSHDQAVASPEAQTTAVAAIKGLFASNSSNVYLFSTFNDYWKVNTPALYMAEQAWGYLGNAPSDVSAGLI